MSAASGSTLFLVGLVWEPQRVWADLLVASYGLLGVGLGAAIFLALLFVTGARWSDRIRPVAERLIQLLPAGAVGMAIVLIAAPTLYPWTAADMEFDSSFQAVWLTRRFFLLRAVTYLGLWLAMAFLLVRASRQVGTGGAARPVGISAGFLVVFALTGWLASADWIMSLEPKWSSTVFGVYHFAGMFLSALAGAIVVAFWLDRRGSLATPLTRDHWRDLGTLLFAFSSFWMYIWFCQYLLIWYVNTPDETDYLVVRHREIWQPLFFASLVLNWCVPFLVLLFRSAKESPLILLSVAIIVLLGRALDLYLMVLPTVVDSEAGFVVWDLGVLGGAAIVAAVILARRFPRAVKGEAV